jgi:hypothetical protein
MFSKGISAFKINAVVFSKRLYKLAKLQGASTQKTERPSPCNCCGCLSSEIFDLYVKKYVKNSCVIPEQCMVIATERG